MANEAPTADAINDAFVLHVVIVEHPRGYCSICQHYVEVRGEAPTNHAGYYLGCPECHPRLNASANAPQQ